MGQVLRGIAIGVWALAGIGGAQAALIDLPGQSFSLSAQLFGTPPFPTPTTPGQYVTDVQTSAPLKDLYFAPFDTSLGTLEKVYVTLSDASGSGHSSVGIGPQDSSALSIMSLFFFVDAPFGSLLPNGNVVLSRVALMPEASCSTASCTAG